MLKRILKWIFIVFGGLIILCIVVVASLYAMGNGRLTKSYSIQPEQVVVPTDQASIQRGKSLASALCTHCHGQDFSGKPLLDDAQVGYVPAPNLTPGEGGASGEFKEADWVRALRHGVDPEGRALIVMPSQNYYYLNDQDLSNLIGYLKSLPAVNHDLGEPKLTFMGKVLLAAGGFGKNILSAEVISHLPLSPELTCNTGSTWYAWKAAGTAMGRISQAVKAPSREPLSLPT